MHAFLSKVFGRKKDDKETSPTSLAPGELLDGKFEAVSPNVSPSAANFLELDPKVNGHEGKDREQDIGFSLFRAKSRPSSPAIKPKKLDTLPHLSLNFREAEGESPSRELGFLFDADPNAETLLTDVVIGQRRLNPLEALVLIQACSQAITTRGLETLGIMHPHWYSSSADVQRRLISHFIHSLNLKSLPTPLSPSPSTSASLFESEIGYTRSPHDIAAVLRWGLRHLQLEGDSFGTDDGWYKAFLDAEAAAEYPPKSFSEKLAPKLPPAHLELLTATLEIFSSLAAHSEVNSTSGSKLSKVFGLWLLTARRVEDKDDWETFYTRWERTGRMLEHLFLARIRDESGDQRMPVRLLELVRRYPYTQGLSSPTTDLQLLPRPRFTTPLYDALFVRIEMEFPNERRKPKFKMHPLNLLADAFSTQVTEGEFAELWAKITAASKNGSNPSPLSNIFADETIRFLSIVPDEHASKRQAAKSPTFSLLPVSPASPVKRTFSEGEQDKSTSSVSQHKKPASEPSPATPISPLAIGSDWVQFSSSGFLDSTPAIAPLVSTLFDTDIEKTVPPDPITLSRKSSKRIKGNSRKSLDLSRTSVVENGVQNLAGTASEDTAQKNKPVVKATKLQIIQFDEAFIDFWSDSLLDPITSTWPTFIICKFKSTLVPSLTYGPMEEGQKQKTLKWLVLEQAYTIRPPPPPPLAPVAIPAPAPVATPPESARPASPAQSTSGKKRFTFWSVSRSTSSSSAGSQKGKKKEKTPKVGEMGELLEEEVKDEVKETSGSKAKQLLDQKSNGEKSVEQVEDKPSAESKAVDDNSKAAGITAAVVTGAIVTGATLAAVAEDKDVPDKEVKSDEPLPTTGPEVLADVTPTQEALPTVETEAAQPSVAPASQDESHPAPEPIAADVEVAAPVQEDIHAERAVAGVAAAESTVEPETHEQVTPEVIDTVVEVPVAEVETAHIPIMEPQVEPAVTPEPLSVPAEEHFEVSTPEVLAEGETDANLPLEDDEELSVAPAIQEPAALDDEKAAPSTVAVAEIPATTLSDEKAEDSIPRQAEGSISVFPVVESVALVEAAAPSASPAPEAPIDTAAEQKGDEVHVSEQLEAPTEAPTVVEAATLVEEEIAPPTIPALEIPHVLEEAVETDVSVDQVEASPSPPVGEPTIASIEEITASADISVPEVVADTPSTDKVEESSAVQELEEPAPPVIESTALVEEVIVPSTIAAPEEPANARIEDTEEEGFALEQHEERSAAATKPVVAVEEETAPGVVASDIPVEASAQDIAAVIDVEEPFATPSVVEPVTLIEQETVPIPEVTTDAPSEGVSLPKQVEEVVPSIEEQAILVEEAPSSEAPAPEAPFETPAEALAAAEVIEDRSFLAATTAIDETVSPAMAGVEANIPQFESAHEDGSTTEEVAVAASSEIPAASSVVEPSQEESFPMTEAEIQAETPTVNNSSLVEPQIAPSHGLNDEELASTTKLPRDQATTPSSSDVVQATEAHNASAVVNEDSKSSEETQEPEAEVIHESDLGRIDEVEGTNGHVTEAASASAAEESIEQAQIVSPGAGVLAVEDAAKPASLEQQESQPPAPTSLDLSESPSTTETESSLAVTEEAPSDGTTVETTDADSEADVTSNNESTRGEEHSSLSHEAPSISTDIIEQSEENLEHDQDQANGSGNDNVPGNISVGLKGPAVNTPSFDQPVIDSAESQPIVNVASSMPFTEPISLPAENSADDLVDLPPVPLVEAAPALESAETYITVPLQESPARELPLLGVSEPPLIDDVPVVEDSRESPVVAASVLSFGSTPGPELALSASVPANIEKTEEHPQPAEVFAADPDARVESKESTGSSYYADLEVTNSIIDADAEPVEAEVSSANDAKIDDEPIGSQDVEKVVVNDVSDPSADDIQAEEIPASIEESSTDALTQAEVTRPITTITEPIIEDEPQCLSSEPISVQEGSPSELLVDSPPIQQVDENHISPPEKEPSSEDLALAKASEPIAIGEVAADTQPLSTPGETTVLQVSAPTSEESVADEVSVARADDVVDDSNSVPSISDSPVITELAPEPEETVPAGDDASVPTEVGQPAVVGDLVEGSQDLAPVPDSAPAPALHDQEAAPAGASESTVVVEDAIEHTASSHSAVLANPAPAPEEVSAVSSTEPSAAQHAVYETEMQEVPAEAQLSDEMTSASEEPIAVSASTAAEDNEESTPTPDVAEPAIGKDDDEQSQAPPPASETAALVDSAPVPEESAVSYSPTPIEDASEAPVSKGPITTAIEPAAVEGEVEPSQGIPRASETEAPTEELTLDSEITPADDNEVLVPDVVPEEPSSIISTESAAVEAEVEASQEIPLARSAGEPATTTDIAPTEDAEDFPPAPEVAVLADSALIPEESASIQSKDSAAEEVEESREHVAGLEAAVPGNSALATEEAIANSETTPAEVGVEDTIEPTSEPSALVDSTAVPEETVVAASVESVAVEDVVEPSKNLATPSEEHAVLADSAPAPAEINEPTIAEDTIENSEEVVVAAPEHDVLVESAPLSEGPATAAPMEPEPIGADIVGEDLSPAKDAEVPSEEAPVPEKASQVEVSEPTAVGALEESQEAEPASEPELSADSVVIPEGQIPAVESEHTPTADSQEALPDPEPELLADSAVSSGPTPIDDSQEGVVHAPTIIAEEPVRAVGSELTPAAIGEDVEEESASALEPEAPADSTAVTEERSPLVAVEDLVEEEPVPTPQVEAPADSAVVVEEPVPAPAVEPTVAEYTVEEEPTPDEPKTHSDSIVLAEEPVASETPAAVDDIIEEESIPAPEPEALADVVAEEPAPVLASEPSHAAIEDTVEEESVPAPEDDASGHSTAVLEGPVPTTEPAPSEHVVVEEPALAPESEADADPTVVAEGLVPATANESVPDDDFVEEAVAAAEPEAHVDVVPEVPISVISSEPAPAAAEKIIAEEPAPEPEIITDSTTVLEESNPTPAVESAVAEDIVDDQPAPTPAPELLANSAAVPEEATSVSEPTAVEELLTASEATNPTPVSEETVPIESAPVEDTVDDSQGLSITPEVSAIAESIGVSEAPVPVPASEKLPVEDIVEHNQDLSPSESAVVSDSVPIPEEPVPAAVSELTPVDKDLSSAPEISESAPVAEESLPAEAIKPAAIEDAIQDTATLTAALLSIENSASVADEALSSAEATAAEKTESIAQPVEELDEDPVVAVAEAEALNGNGNGHHATARDEKTEAVGDLDATVAEPVEAELESSSSDGNTQITEEFSPTTLIEEDLNAHLVSKVEALLATSNDHEFKALDEVIAPPKQIEADVTTTAAEVETTPAADKA